HDVNDDVAGINQNPFAAFFAFNADDRGAGFFQLIANVLRERLDLPRRVGASNDQRVVEAGELADIENGDVASLDVFESGNGYVLQSIEAHPKCWNGLDRARGDQYRPKRCRGANSAWRRRCLLRARSLRELRSPKSAAE